MGHVSVTYVPHTRTYTEAKKRFDETTPIRGRADNRRPLGRRRDADTFWLQEDCENGVMVIKYMAYRTPVVTYFEDGRVRIKSDGWASPSTHQFIQRALRIETNGQNRETTMRMGEKLYQLRASNDYTLWVRVNEYGRCTVDEALWTEPPRYNYRMNRKKANKVRAQYKPFADYLKGFLSLRMQEGTDFCTFSYQELADLVGVHVNAWGSEIIKMDDYIHGFERPSENKRGDKIAQMQKYLDCGRNIVALITGDTEGFYKAAMVFTSGGRSYWIRDATHTMYRARPEAVQENFNDFILRWHAEDVLDKIEVADGTLPSGKYKNWL